MTRLAVALVAIVLTSSCSSSTNDARPVRVFAAASLTEVFDEIAVDFEDANPGVEVELVFAGSSSLVAQAAEGAPFDVLATADETTMKRAFDNGDVGAATVLATNHVAIVTQRELVNTPLDELTIALCAPEVPCGNAAVELLSQLEIDVNAVSFETSVSGVLTKLALDEVDAGVVYVSDLSRSEADLAIHDANGSSLVTNRYLVAVGADNTAADAAAFVQHLSSTQAKQRLVDAGFDPP